MSIFGGCLGSGGVGVGTVTFPVVLNANGDISDAAVVAPWSGCGL